MSKCVLTPFQRRLYCSKKRVGKSCRSLRFLGHRCPNLMWTRDEVMEEAQKGAKEIISASGFSEEALEYSERYRPELRLRHKDRIVKPRRRLKKRVARENPLIIKIPRS